jgi:hypothetical protein
MRTIPFVLEDEQLKLLLEQYPRIGKNGDIAKITVEVVKLYFLSLDTNAKFISGGRNQPDITVLSNGASSEYEIKGTEDIDIAFSKLKVSSLYCYQKLIDGMEIIRVTSVRNKVVQLHFMKHDEDFTMKPEPRWALEPLKKGKKHEC